MLLQRVREWLVLFLIAFLPFHAFLVTVGTSLLAGAGKAPLPWLAIWKELVLVVILGVALVELVLYKNPKHEIRNSKQIRNPKFQIDVLDWLIIGLLVLGVSVSAIHYSLLTTPFFFGFKYTLFPLLLFLLLRRVSWSERSFQLSVFSFQVTGILVAVYGIVTLFLPAQFFAWLGYSDLHSTYLPDGPLAAFQYLEGTGIRRMQATFAGPNQLGMWLLIPFSVALIRLLCGRAFSFQLSAFSFFALSLFLTFSRAAWIGAAVIVGVLLATRYPLPARRWLFRYLIISLFGVAAVSALVFPEVLLRGASSREHFRRPLQALRVIAQHPLGLGLGAAGPAANRTGDACVFLEEGADASWAADRPALCVFVSDKQVQPLIRVCQCPLLPENWYLQVGVELGLFGLLLFAALVILVIKKLIFNFPVFLSFIGISVAAIFLHAWEDSAVAYTVWILVAAALPSFNHRRSSPSTIVR